MIPIEPLTLAQAVHQHATGDGNRPALSFVSYEGGLDGTTTTWTYAELDARATAVAAELQRRRAAGDGVAAILAPPGLDYIAAFLGCISAGVRAVPLYPPDAVHDASRLARLLAQAAPRWLLTTTTALPSVEQLSGEPVCVDAVAPAAAGWTPPTLSGDGVAYLQYTSGSTADPRGVMVTHANLAHTARQSYLAYDLDAHRVSVSWLPLFHDLGLAVAATVPLCYGRHAVMMSPLAFLQRPARWFRLIHHHRASFTAAPNFALDLCADRVRAEDLRGIDLSCLLVLLTGAEPVRPSSLRRFTDAFARYGLRASAHTPSYGLAEATVLVTAVGPAEEPSVLGCDRQALGEGAVRPVTDRPGAADTHWLVGAGRPVDQRVVIVDTATHREVPPGRVGEVWIHGPNVTAGYLNRPELTRSTFHARLRHPDGRSAGPRWLRTGDLGFIHEGQLYLVGRLDDVIIIDGRNHHPVDIEATVEAADHRVRPGGVVAFGIDDGRERLVVVAEVDPRLARGRDGDPDEVAQAVRGAVARHHGVEVSDVCLVRRGAIARTSSGKVARATCRRRYLDGGYPPGDAGRRPPSGGGGRADRDAYGIEQWLIATVAERLKLPASAVDPHTELVAYGFSSADAVAFTGDAERRYGITVAPTLFWEHPTIRAVSEHLAASLAAAEPDGRGEPDVPAGGQRPAGAFDRLLRSVEQGPPPDARPTR